MTPVSRYLLTTQTACVNSGAICAPGCAVLQQLEIALKAAAPYLAENFEMDGTVTVPRCAACPEAGSCLLAWRADACGVSLLGAVNDAPDPGAALLAARRTGRAPALLHAEPVPQYLV